MARTLIGKHQCGASLGRFAANLRIEIHHHDVPGVRNIGSYHSTTSFPTSAPVEISP